MLPGLKRGLTLAELLIAFVLVTVVALLMTGLFLQLLQASAKRSDLTVGRVFAEATLEEVVRAGLYEQTTCGICRLRPRAWVCACLASWPRALGPPGENASGFSKPTTSTQPASGASIACYFASKRKWGYCESNRWFIVPS